MFSSCENFLQANEVKNQIEEAIEIANSSPVTIFVTPDENTGTAIPNQLQVKKNYEIILSFKPSGNYKFINWEVLNRQTGQPVEGVIEFEDEKALETRATVLKVVENLVIRPKCILQPAVDKISPSPTDQNFANVSITIHFNMAMEDSIVDKVKLSYFGTEIADYFEKPVLNSSKNTLIIKPKVEKIGALIEKEKTGYIDVAVVLSEAISVQIEGNTVFLIQNENSKFYFRYSKLTERIDPVKSDYFLSRDEVDLNSDLNQIKRFHDDMIILDGTDEKLAECWANDTAERVIDNAVGKYVYIYGKFLDADSGVYKVSVYEQALGTRLDFAPQSPFLSKEYYLTDSEVEFITDQSGTTIFRIKHFLTAPDGQVLIKCDVSDACGNTCTTDQILTYKKTVLDFIDDLEISNEDMFYRGHLGTNFDENIYNVKLKTLYAENDEEVCLDGWLDLCGWIEDFYHIDCIYNGNKEPQPFVYGPYGLEITLNVDKLSGQHLVFIVSDILGNAGKIDCPIAKSENFCVMKLKAGDKTKARTYYSSGETTGNLDFIKKDSAGKITFSCYDSDMFEGEMEAGCTYRFIPHHNVNGKTRNGIHFYTEIPEKEYSVNDQQSAVSIPEVALLTPSKPADSYEIVKNKKQELLDVTVKLAANTWDYDYDSIILYVKEKALVMRGEDLGDKYEWIDNGDKVIGFTKGQTEATVTVVNEEMYKSDCEIVIYGLKDSVSTSGTALTIPQFTKTDIAYDNFYIPKIITVSRNNDFCTTTITDEQTGVMAAYVIEGSEWYDNYKTDYEAAKTKAELAGKTIITSTVKDDYSHTLKYPVWMVSDKGYTYYLVDKAGNVTCEKAGYYKNKFKYYATIRDVIIKDSKIKITAFRNSSITSHSITKAQFYIPGTSNGKFIWEYKNQTVCAYSISDEGTTMELSDYPTNQFIRISFDKDFYNQYAYIYTGTSNTGNKDYVYPPSKNGVAVSSDAPVLCRTICTDKPYSECRDWTMEEWEQKLRCIKEEVLSFTTSAYSPKIYKMAYKDSDLRGLCSVVIVYFADGTKAISNVVQN